MTMRVDSNVAMRVRRDGITDVEYGLRPPLRQAITLPVQCVAPTDGRSFLSDDVTVHHVTLYVGVTVFEGKNPLTDGELCALAAEIAARLEG